VSWCDKLASTPGVGVKLDKSFVPAATMLEPLAPIVSTWVDQETDKPAFSIDHQDLYSCALTSIDGYHYVIGPETLGVEFRHRLKYRPQSAGPPTAELISKPAPFTELLPEVTKRLLELVRLVTKGQPRKLLRIGVYSTTVVVENQMPPGIDRFLKYASKPWDASLDFYDLQLTSKLPKTKRTIDYDRCIHAIQKSEDGEGLVNIRLDWQRYLGKERSLSPTTLPELIEGTAADALSYFEDIGQGERFDV
jgi:hypothetical protein